MDTRAEPDLEDTVEAVRWRDVYTTSKDNLSLYARDYGSRISPLTPVVCLPGLTRNSKDFHELALHLGEKRRVLCLDYRGRGRSDTIPTLKIILPTLKYQIPLMS